SLHGAKPPISWKPQAVAMVAVPKISASVATGTAMSAVPAGSVPTSAVLLAMPVLRGRAEETGRSEEIARRDDPAYERHGDEGGDELQPPLDEGADRLAIGIEQGRLDEEAGAAGDERQHDEQQEVVAGEAGGDRHHLVGDRRQPLD